MVSDYRDLVRHTPKRTWEISVVKMRALATASEKCSMAASALISDVDPVAMMIDLSPSSCSSTYDSAVVYESDTLRYSIETP